MPFCHENLIVIHVALDECRDAQDELPDFRVDTVRLPSARDGVERIRISVTNVGTATARPTSVALTIGVEDYLGADPEAWRFYKEGLTVVGVAGSRRSGDCDFELDPNFLPLTVSDPATYRWDRSGRFHAEQVGVVQNERTGEALLAGLVTSTVALGRIALDAGAPHPYDQLAAGDLRGVNVSPSHEPVPCALLRDRGGRLEAEDVPESLGATPLYEHAFHVPAGVYRKFSTDYGVHATLGANQPIVFEVWCDERLLFQDVRRAGEAAGSATLDWPADGTLLRLVATVGADAPVKRINGRPVSFAGHAVWGRPRLVDGTPV